MALPKIYDMHCHLGFCDAPARAAADLGVLGVGGFSATVEPAEYLRLVGLAQGTVVCDSFGNAAARADSALVRADAASVSAGNATSPCDNAFGVRTVGENELQGDAAGPLGKEAGLLGDATAPFGGAAGPLENAAFLFNETSGPFGDVTASFGGAFASFGKESAQFGDASASFGKATVPFNNAFGTDSGFAGLAGFRIGLGLHPWWVPCEVDARMLDAWEELSAQTRFIGEVGLDFAPRHLESADEQRSLFSHIVACAVRDARESGQRRVLSIHAVRSASAVLDILSDGDAFDACTCIFHWFSGTPEELRRAVAAGCSFSVGTRMLATKRGRNLARLIPVDRLLLESDAPDQDGDPWDARSHFDGLAGAQDALTTLFGSDIQAQLALNSRSILE